MRLPDLGFKVVGLLGGLLMLRVSDSRLRSVGVWGWDGDFRRRRGWKTKRNLF